MAKTIKFNLICDGKSVRTLDDLKNNFSIEDILNYYNNQLLQRWLNVRGYNEELEKVEKLQGLDTLDLVKELIAIFGVETDSVLMEENTYILQYKQLAELQLEEYKKLDFEVSHIIDDYHLGYRQLVDSIVENKNDIAKIKAAIKEIDKRYASLYELDYRNLFYTFFENAPMAVFVMLMNRNMREKYLPTITMGEKGEKLDDTDEFSDTFDEDKKYMYDKIMEFFPDNYRGYLGRRRYDHSELNEVFGENLRVFSGETDGYWKDVEPKGKKYIVLSMESGNYIRNAGLSGEELGSEDIDGKFLILDGIDYKSNDEDDKLLYMEV